MSDYGCVWAVHADVRHALECLRSPRTQAVILAARLDLDRGVRLETDLVEVLAILEMVMERFNDDGSLSEEKSK